MQFSKALHVDLRNICFRQCLSIDCKILLYPCVLDTLCNQAWTCSRERAWEHAELCFALIASALADTLSHLRHFTLSRQPEIVRATDNPTQTIVCHFLTHAGTPVVQHTLQWLLYAHSFTLSATYSVPWQAAKWHAMALLYCHDQYPSKLTGNTARCCMLP